MSSQAQINANRLNSQKSTGPTSPEGKATSSLNALKSGIDAHTTIITGENPADLEALTAAFLLDHQPANASQLALVDVLINSEWTLRRLRRVEAQLWNYRHQCLDESLPESLYRDETFNHDSPLGHIFHDRVDIFNRLHRRIESTQRMFLHTLDALAALRKAAVVSGHPVAPVPKPLSPVEPQALPPPIGFVPPGVPIQAPVQSPTARSPQPRPIGFVPSGVSFQPRPVQTPAAPSPAQLASFHQTLRCKTHAPRPLLEPNSRFCYPQ